MLIALKEGAALVNNRLANLSEQLKKRKDYIVVQTPVQWAQSLDRVFIEVRYAHRHDAPGCSRSEDEVVEITEREISVSVLCIENNSKVRYKMNLKLWDKIDVEKSRNEYQAVGRQHFTLTKLKSPARWARLFADGETKPINYRLWLAQHEVHVQSLWEFRGDAIDKFEGYQWMEEMEDAYQEFKHRKSIPKKGPIPL
jgi:hypothetical protein